MIHDVHSIEEPNAQPTVTIDGEEYSMPDLPVQTQADIARLHELRVNAARLQRELNETVGLIQMYDAGIKKSVQPVKDEEDEAVVQ